METILNWLDTAAAIYWILAIYVVAFILPIVVGRYVYAVLNQYPFFNRLFNALNK